MGLLQGGGNADGIAHSRLVIQRPVVLYDFLQGAAHHVFHDDVIDIVFIAAIVDIHDVRVGQSRRVAGFLPEPGHELLILDELVPQDLDAHIPVQYRIIAVEHLGHAATADFIDNLIATV